MAKDTVLQEEITKLCHDLVSRYNLAGITISAIREESDGFRTQTRISCEDDHLLIKSLSDVLDDLRNEVNKKESEND